MTALTIESIARKYAVKNAHEHDGKAQVGAVVGKVKALLPETDLKSAMPIISKVIAEVHALKKADLEKEYKAFEAKGWELKNETKEKTLPELDWFKPGMQLITRVAPNPSGAMHFGHARPAVLTDEYVKKYGGTFILRFDDTDPKVKIPIAGIEKEFLSEFKWLDIHVDSVQRASDRLDRYYEILEKLLADGNAYVCDCESETWRELTWKKKACPCRDKKPAVQLTAWKKMLAHEIKEEQAVVRIKTDLKHKDSAMRDWWAAKVVDVVDHPNPAVRHNHVWPSYNLASAVDDHDGNINFIIRGQEHIPNEEKQRFLYDYFKWEYPHTLYHGKIGKLGDMTLSKSKIKTLMEEQGLTRDDDPRLATLKAFRRRGFLPQTIRKVILACGVGIQEVKISMDMIAAFNRELLGDVTEYPFFEEAVKVDIRGIAPGEGESYGEKINFTTTFDTLLVDKKELLKHKVGALVRFKKGFNAKLTSVTEFGAEAQFISYAKTNYPTLGWIEEGVDVEILMSDGTMKLGFSSPSIVGKKGMVRFEGIGYARIESEQNGKVSCIYAHN